jgi:hypothetical protein
MGHRIVTVSQMCTCGAKFQAATVTAVWQLMDAHHAAVHTKRRTAFTSDPAVTRRRGRARRAPLTPQGGES